jgi:peptidoglycan/xylan/chitin deacetylase (PgdA/CDA1 family)
LENKAIILCYHRVIKDNPDFFSIPGTQVDLQNFTAQLRFLSRKYRLISFHALVKRLQEGNLDENFLVFSFDDGFKDNYNVAFPVLKKYQVPAIFFISPVMIGNRSLLWNNRVWFLLHSKSTLDCLHWKGREFPLNSECDKLKTRDFINQFMVAMKEDERKLILRDIAVALESPHQTSQIPELMMNLDDVFYMINSGLAEFGSHSLSHSLLPLCGGEQLIHEIEGSKKALESVLGRPVYYFAYPNGAYDKKSIDSIRTAGYEAAATTNEGLVAPGDDLFLLKRVNVVRDDTIHSILIKKILPLYLSHIFCYIKEFLNDHRKY